MSKEKKSRRSAHKAQNKQIGFLFIEAAQSWINIRLDAIPGVHVACEKQP